MGVFDAIGDVLTLGYDIYKDTGLTGAEKEQNAFNAQEAQRNRDFQSAQAQVARDWQEEQYLKYNSPSARVRQYQEAGLNPALMYGASSTGNASTSTGIPSGSAASGGAGGAQRISAVSALANLRLLKSQIDNIDADTHSKEIANDWSPKLFKQEWETGEINKRSLETSIDLALANVSKAIQETDNLKAQRQLMNYQAALLQAQEQYERNKSVDLNTRLIEQIWRNSFYDRNGYYPGTSLYDIMIDKGVKLTSIVIDDMSGRATRAPKNGDGVADPYYYLPRLH